MNDTWEIENLMKALAEAEQAAAAATPKMYAGTHAFRLRLRFGKGAL